ncbi:hypothetical protein SDC9_60533 [bioreactor metagenome]|uniref:Uncharacterized protein n=1 Tax=bioreactor metagenome TaxID=1076179 RepID=A0A644XIY2_9ZZZZ
MFEGHAYKLNSVCIGSRSPRRNTSSVWDTKSVNKVLEDFGSIGVNNIDIDVSNFFTVFVCKSGEHCIPRFWVEVNNISDIRHARPANGATGWTNRNSIFPTPAN